MNAHFESEYELSELGILVGSYEPRRVERENTEMVRVMRPHVSHEKQRAARAALTRLRGARTPAALLAAIVARQEHPRVKDRRAR